MEILENYYKNKELQKINQLKQNESLEDYLKSNVKCTASIQDAEKALFDYKNKVLNKTINNKLNV